jgi:hypothetical protein
VIPQKADDSLGIPYVVVVIVSTVCNNVQLWTSGYVYKWLVTFSDGILRTETGAKRQTIAVAAPNGILSATSR